MREEEENITELEKEHGGKMIIEIKSETDEWTAGVLRREMKGEEEDEWAVTI